MDNKWQDIVVIEISSGWVLLNITSNLMIEITFSINTQLITVFPLFLEKISYRYAAFVLIFQL